MHISTTNPSGRSSPDSSIELVGQLAASNLTNWRLGQFCKGIALPTRGIHIEGPAVLVARRQPAPLKEGLEIDL